MECIVLTGITGNVIKELQKGIPRTIELNSAHNIISVASVNPGEQIFMTSVTCEDLNPGDTGIILEIIAISINVKQYIDAAHGIYIVEQERTYARIKTKYIGNSTIKSITECSLTKPRKVDVVRPARFHAR